MPVLHFVRFADYFVNCAALVAEPLAIMFQESFQSAILPSDWKSANIVPIFRKGDKTDQNDYRPVSVTPVPCKIMESIIKDSITDNLKPTNQCVKAAAKARSVHGVARRHFKYLDPRDFLIIYKSYVRPNLEYCIQALSRTYLQKDIYCLESVQRAATRLVRGFRNVPYEDRLRILELTTHGSQKETIILLNTTRYYLEKKSGSISVLSAIRYYPSPRTQSKSDHWLEKASTGCRWCTFC